MTLQLDNKVAWYVHEMSISGLSWPEVVDSIRFTCASVGDGRPNGDSDNLLSDDMVTCC